MGIGMGFLVFLGLAFIFWDMKPAWRARLMGRPMLIHFIVIGSGLMIHGGSAEGAMAAVISGVFSAIYVRIDRRMRGYIDSDGWHPGHFGLNDPRSAA